MNTLTPSLASRNAIALPIPREAPDTIAIFPLRPRIYSVPAMSVCIASDCATTRFVVLYLESKIISGTYLHP
jgi:hypothetical protein